MALDHTMILGVFRSPAGNTNMLRVTQGAKAVTSMRQQVKHTATNTQSMANQMFTFNGNVYLPFGSFVSGIHGWAKYNPELDEFETLDHRPTAGRLIPLFDRVGWFWNGEQGWGFSPEDKQGFSGSVGTLTPNDYAVVGGNVTILSHFPTKKIGFWPYPFDVAPTLGAAFALDVWRVCEIGGEVYGVEVNSGGGTIDLYRVIAGTLTLVGAPSAHAGLANYDGAIGMYYSLFKFNNKLFFIVHTKVIGQQKLRLFEVDVTAGTSVERNAYLPAEWGNILNPSISTTGSIFEVRDDIGASEQVFLVRSDRDIGGWECYEFAEGAFPVVLTGQGDHLFPLSGAIYDPSAKAAQIKSAADTVPSDHVTMEIEVFDLQGQGTVDIDPRYRLNNVEPPPYAVCTGKAPNDGKTALASVPVGITTLANLSDDFEAGLVNDELWQLYSESILSWSSARDVGACGSGAVGTNRVRQIGGALRFGKDAETTEALNGMGVKCRWSMNGAFQVDFTLKDPDNIKGVGAAWGNAIKSIIGLIRLSPNEGFGFVVWKSTTGPQVKIRGIYMQLDGVITFTADFNAADGDVVRIERDGGNVWVVTKDPDGVGSGTQIITPGGGSNYAEPVYIVMAGHPGSTNNSWVEPATPDGQEAGFSDIDVSGAGSLGLYDGGVKHLFDWDHITDEPPPKSGTAELFVDSET